MTTIAVLIVAVVVLLLVAFWSGRYGGRNRKPGTSLRRRARSHTTARGRAKVAYERSEAQAQARFLSQRDGVAMSAYQCDTCSKWHVGHAR